MVTHTREKLEETKYFLGMMKATQAKLVEFPYNLSAFLSAARSVTLFMKKEFNKSPGFTEWYEGTKIDEDEMMKVFNQKRVMTVHQKSVRPQVNITLSIPEDIPLGDREAPPLRHLTRKDILEEFKWFFEDLQDNDVLSLCEEHILKLESLVNECESKFGALKNP